MKVGWITTKICRRAAQIDNRRTLSLSSTTLHNHSNRRYTPTRRNGQVARNTNQHRNTDRCEAPSGVPSVRRFQRSRQRRSVLRSDHSRCTHMVRVQYRWSSSSWCRLFLQAIDEWSDCDELGKIELLEFRYKLIEDTGLYIQARLPR